MAEKKEKKPRKKKTVEEKRAYWREYYQTHKEKYAEYRKKMKEKA